MNYSMNKMTGVSMIRLLLMFIGIQSIIVHCEEVFQNDESFNEFCKRYNGAYDGAQTKKDKGATCTVKFRISTANQEQADRYCRDWVPQQFVSSARSDKEVTCVAQVSHICKSGWTNLYGVCYKLMDNGRPMTKSEAVTKCIDDGAELYQYSRPDVPEMLSITFDLSTIWLMDSDVDARLIGRNPMAKPGTGSARAMVFNSAPILHVRFMSIIPIDPNKKSMVICTKPGKMMGDGNIPELVKPLNLPLIWSDTIFYQTNLHARRGDIKDYDTVCARYFKPFLNEDSLKQAFFPDNIPVVLPYLDKFSHFIRIGGQRDVPQNRHQERCFNMFANYHGSRKIYQIQNEFMMRSGFTRMTMVYVPWLKFFFPQEACDSQYSTSLVFKPKPWIFEMSDAYRAPIICEITQDHQIAPVYREKCYTRWTTSALRNCFTFLEFPKDRGEADHLCWLYTTTVHANADGSELEQMRNMMTPWPFEYAWIGEKRGNECLALSKSGQKVVQSCGKKLPVFCGWRLRPWDQP